jgi:integrase
VIRAQMLLRVARRAAILAHRDRTIVSLQYGLAARNQEVWGLRWLSLDGDFAWVTEVLSCGQLEQWGKTQRSTQRRVFVPSILREDLKQWRAILIGSGRAARDIDFIIPGDLTGAEHGVREADTGACHLSNSQAKIWGPNCFTPAVRAVAKRPEFARILGATPYALRRGGISLRLRSEDPQTVASECGTSLKMLSDHYSFPIEDLRQHEPRPADVEWRAARAALTERRTQEQALAARPTPEGARPRGKLSAWFAARRRSRGS